MSNGRGPTLWRTHGGAWNTLYKGQTAVLQHGDQVSLDCSQPEGAVFTCQFEGGGMYGQQGMQQGAYGGQQQQQGAYGGGGGGYGYGQQWYR